MTLPEQGSEAAGALARPGPPRDDPWAEILFAWAAAIGLVWAGCRISGESGGPLFAAAAWLLVPIALHLRARRPLADEGFRWARPLRSGWLVLAYAAVGFPVYAALFFLVYGSAGFRRPSLAIIPVAFLGELFFHGLPEEAFFRGFVQPRLEVLYGHRLRLRIPGVPVDGAVLAGAALFALTHVAFLPNPLSIAAVERLTTFFPGILFGALRKQSGDIVTPAIFHALCNTLVYGLQHGYLT